MVVVLMKLTRAATSARVAKAMFKVNGRAVNMTRIVADVTLCMAYGQRQLALTERGFAERYAVNKKAACKGCFRGLGAEDWLAVGYASALTTALPMSSVDTRVVPSL
jgi:hypothetical protein